MNCECTTVYENSDERTIYLKLLGLDGVEPSDITVEIKIAGDLQARRALGIMHGAHINHHFMESLTPWLDDMKLIYLSAPGRLGSSPIETLTGDAYAAIFSRAFACLKEQGEFDSLDLLGYSMGGYLGTRICLLREVEVGRLVYFFSCAGGPTGIDDSIELVTNHPESRSDPEMLGCIAVKGFAPGAPAEYMGMVAAMLPVCGAPPEWMINDMIALGKTDYMAQLEDLPAGTKFMFVNGADDQVILGASSMATADRLAGLGFDVSVVTVPDCGHIDFPRKLHNDLLTGERGIALHVREFLNS